MELHGSYVWKKRKISEKFRDDLIFKVFGTCFLQHVKTWKPGGYEYYCQVGYGVSNSRNTKLAWFYYWGECFCRPHASNIQNFFEYIHFDKIKLIFYPQDKNSTTHLTLINIRYGKFRLLFKVYKFSKYTEFDMKWCNFWLKGR